VSGGEYNYAYAKVEAFATKFPAKGGCYPASESKRERFRKHLELVADAMWAIEWNDSGDGCQNEEDLISICLGEAR